MEGDVPSNVAPYYLRDNDVSFQGTRCSESVEGSVQDGNAADCFPSPSGDAHPSCKFVLDEAKYQHANESLLFASNIDSVSS